MCSSDLVHRIVLVTRATHLWRATHEFTAVGLQVIPGPTGMTDSRDGIPLSRYMPDPESSLRSYAAVYELLGDEVRRFLALTHLRRH